jgi:hypothetical protein
MLNRLYWILVFALLGSALPAEASRKHAIRPPTSIAAPQPSEVAPEVAEVAEKPAAQAEEPKTVRAAAPRRGLLEVLFGRGGNKPAKVAVGRGVEVDERMVEAV